MSAKRHTLGRHALQRKLLVVAVSSCFVADAAFANPTGPSVAHGQASFSSLGSNLTVTNAPGTVINWQAFSIAGSESVRFNQQSASSSVLNRVVGVNPSSILGTLQSNGRVFLVNPNGITIGPGASIDVAGFLASTLNYSDSDFLAGRLKFSSNADYGSVVNQGVINTASGGMVYLIGQDVQNSGIIQSPKGEIILAAGKSVELVDAQTPEVRVQVSAPDNQALNIGQLIAAGGSIGIYGAMVKHGGTASANTAVMGENGKIVFKAIKDVTLAAGSVASANGSEGGSVTAQAETGTLIASGIIEAKGEAGRGGTVQLLGAQVGLTGAVQVDASGDAGGGTVLVGGDFQGRNAGIQNAQRTFVGPDARISSDAVSSGSGGKVVVWADGDTRYYGRISARGGAQSGDGGLVEVSGKEVLNFDGKADVGAVNGRSGTILLDPRDIIIADTVPGGGGDNAQVSDSKILFADTPVNSDFTISDEALEALTGSIVLQAQRDIQVSAGLSGGGLVMTNQKGSESERAVFQAGRHIIIDSAVKTDGAKIWLEADSPHVNGYDGITGISGADGVGAVRVNALVQSFLTDAATGGKITLIGGTKTSGGTNGGGFELQGDVNAGAGGIDVALSMQSSGTLSFNIGSSGEAQFTTTDTGQLKSTGPLKIGEATTAGTDGLGANAITIKVDQLAIGSTAGGLTLASDAGTSVEFTAGDGGILVERPLSTNQSTTIDTTGALTINNTLNTGGNNLTINAESISGISFINTGAGSFSCTGEGCNTSSIITWDGGGSNLDWFTATNWSGDIVPTINDEVRIPSTFSGSGPIAIAGAASAKNLIADYSVSLSGTLTLAQASQFTRGFTLTTGSSLTGAGHVVVNGTSGLLTWSGGTMTSGGDFTLGVGGSGTLSGSLVLDRLFNNSGMLTLNAASLSGTGTLANSATVTAASSTSNTLGVTLTNSALIQAQGSLTATAFPTNDGSISVGSGGTFTTGAAALTNTASSSLIVTSGNYSSSTGSVTTSGGNLAVSGALNAGSVTLSASGSVTLNAGSSITATGSVSDSIVINGARFANSAGSGALSPGVGRYLVWSSNANPFGDGTPDDRGSLAYDFKQYNATYGSTTVLGTGNGFLYTLAPVITPTLQGSVTKTYDGLIAATLAGGNFTSSGFGEVDGDTVVLSNPATGVYGSAHAGSGLTVTASSASTLSSATNGAATVYGYQVSGSPASGSVGTITAKTLTASASIGGTTSKTYDGLTAASGATVSGSTSGAITGDTVALDTSGVSLNYNSAHVASATTISATGSVAIGSVGGTNVGDGVSGRVQGLAGDYVLSGQPVIASVAGTITPKALVVSGPTIGGTTTKVYDGTTVTAATLTGGSVTGIAGDTLTLDTSGVTLAYDSAHVASVTKIGATGAVGYTIGGSAAGSQLTDYSFVAPVIADHVAVNLITPVVISLAGSRPYDNSASFAPSAFGIVNGVNGETLVVASGSGTVSSPKVLAGTQALNPGTLALGNGSGQASNYTLTGGTHTGTITANASVPFAWDIASATDLNWENPANWNQGAVPMSGAMASIPGGLGGAVVYSSASGATSLKTLNSGSGFTISGGTLTLGNSSADVSTFSGRPLTVNGGTLNGPGTISLAGVTLDVLAGGVLGGSRTIIGNVNNSAGTVSPGASPGIMTIDGNYSQGAGGVLRAEVGGLTPGSGYDQLIVTGTANLAGVLDVSLVNGFVPVDGNRFSIIQSSGSVTGTFSQVNLPANPVMSLNYLASIVELASSQQVNTEQLISVQVDSTNNSSPNTDLLPVSTTSNTVSSGDLNLANTYLDAGGGQIVPLSSTTNVDPGVYVNVATGETTILQSGSLPEPGVYLSADQKTVIAVTIDPETGRLVLMTGEVGSATGVGATAKVQKPGVCQ